MKSILMHHDEPLLSKDSIKETTIVNLFCFKTEKNGNHKEGLGSQSAGHPPCRYLLRRCSQVPIKIFDELAEKVTIVILLTAPSMRRTRCKGKVEVLALFNQFFS